MSAADGGDEREAARDDLPDAPRTCWEIHVNAFRTDYTRLPDGGMILHLTPVVRGPGGQALAMAPQVVIHMPPAGWDRFKAEVAADGRREPPSQLATPPPPRIVLPR